MALGPPRRPPSVPRPEGQVLAFPARGVYLRAYLLRVLDQMYAYYIPD